MKKLWSGIRSIINVSSKSGYCISQLIQDGKEIDDPKTMVNIFNKFFVNVSQKVTRRVEFQEHRNAFWIISNREMINHCFYLMLLLKKLKL